MSPGIAKCPLGDKTAPGWEPLHIQSCFEVWGERAAGRVVGDGEGTNSLSGWVLHCTYCGSLLLTHPSLPSNTWGHGFFPLPPSPILLSLTLPTFPHPKCSLSFFLPLSSNVRSVIRAHFSIVHVIHKLSHFLNVFFLKEKTLSEFCCFLFCLWSSKCLPCDSHLLLEAEFSSKPINISE